MIILKYREFIQKYEEICEERKKEKNSVKLLIENIENISPTDLYIKYEENIKNDTKNKFVELFDKYTLNNIPVQYLTNKQIFFGLSFYVDERCLIPRRETEELVDYLSKYINAFFPNKTINLLDMCTGSGCIGLSLKSILKDKTNVYLSDISKDAIDVSNINKKQLNLDVKIIKSDLFQNLCNYKFDCIVSNPPYIPYTQEVEELVKQNEPHLALFAENNGLYFYDKILSESNNYINDKVIIAFEHGDDQKDDINKLVLKYYPKANIVNIKDMQERDRMTFIFINR